MIGTKEASHRPSLWPDFSHLGKDFGASLVVFLVAVPLSMAIANASGAPILSGLMAAVVGGIVVGLFAGAPLQASGPAAGLSVVILGLVQQHGFPAVCTMVAVAGLIQIGGGSLRIARMAMAISPAVLHGMLAGIGVLIVLGQIHVVLGGTPQSSAWKNLRELPEQLQNLHGMATAIGLLTIAVVLAWPLVPIKKLRLIPAPLVAATVGTLVALPFEMPRVVLNGGLFSSLAAPLWPAGGLPALIAGALTIAAIASAESLACAVATDKLHAGPRANLDRELFAQGLGNFVSGLLGGLPITGVIVRSKANIDGGAKTRWSTVLHGVWVLLFVTQLGSVINKIPLSVLAGLLVVVGIGLLRVEHIRELYRHHESRIYFVTLLGVVGINLLVGIGLGIAAAAVMLVLRLSNVKVAIDREVSPVQVKVEGTLTFLGVPKLSTQLSKLAPGTDVEFVLDVEYMDHAGIEALRSFATSHRRTGAKVVLELLNAGSSSAYGALPPGARSGNASDDPRPPAHRPRPENHSLLVRSETAVAR